MPRLEVLNDLDGIGWPVQRGHSATPFALSVYLTFYGTLAPIAGTRLCTARASAGRERQAAPFFPCHRRAVKRIPDNRLETLRQRHPVNWRWSHNRAGAQFGGARHLQAA